MSGTLEKIPVYELCILGDAESPHDAIRSLLHTSLTHFAEFQIRMLEVLSKKFGHSLESLVEAIRDAPELSGRALAIEVVQKAVVEKVIPAAPPVLKTKAGKKVVVKNKKVVHDVGKE